jgi:hypothetical protein
MVGDPIAHGHHTSEEHSFPSPPTEGTQNPPSSFTRNQQSLELILGNKPQCKPYMCKPNSQVCGNTPPQGAGLPGDSGGWMGQEYVISPGGPSKKAPVLWALELAAWSLYHPPRQRYPWQELPCQETVVRCTGQHLVPAQNGCSASLGRYPQKKKKK